MKVPRDLSGKDLIKRLKVLGYEPSRQNGSHIRLTTRQKGEHHITIPNHDPLRIGTLSAILDLIAEHFQISKSELLERLFG
jgi:predicted RNA binding protein YcfA (HicA-like mRNA interferase family)